MATKTLIPKPEQGFGGRAIGEKVKDSKLFIPLYTYLYNMFETRKVYPVDITPIEKELNQITEKLQISKAEAIRQAIRYYAEWVRDLKIITPRIIPLEEAKKEILKYLETREDVVYTDEIAEALNLDFDLTHKALMELWKDGEVDREKD